MAISAMRHVKAIAVIQGRDDGLDQVVRSGLILYIF